MPEPFAAVDNSGMARALRRERPGSVVTPDLALSDGGRVRRGDQLSAIVHVITAVLGHRVRRRHKTLGRGLDHHDGTAYDLSPAAIPAHAGPPAITAR